MLIVTKPETKAQKNQNLALLVAVERRATLVSASHILLASDETQPERVRSVIAFRFCGPREW